MSSLSPTATGVTVEPVVSRKDLDEFIRLPWRIYRGNKRWVPPLLMIERQKFDPKRNAFYKHAEVQLFVARKDGRVVGRICAHVDDEHNRYHEERTGFFGFFEAPDDPEVAEALLSAAERWLRERGMDRMRGPLSFSVNGEVGFLAEGFGKSPLPLMPYSQPYYLSLVEGAGFAKVKDVFSWRWQSQPVPEGSPRKMAAELRARPDVTARRARMSDFRAEVDRILEMYNDAWSENWGFVPATKAEADEMSNELRLVVDTAIIPIVEVNGVPAGVALAMPNVNWAIKPLNGKLFPFGWARLLWRLKVRRPKSGRLLLLGIKKEFRTRAYAGLTYLLCDELYRGANQRGYKWAEFGWTLEDNGLINAVIKKVGATHSKTYRVYEKTL